MHLKLTLMLILTLGMIAAAADKQPATDQEFPDGYVNEAPLPEGFPPPSAVGKVVEKSYPVIRSFSASGDNAFSKCFTYLVLKRHEMTAPVVMSYDKSKAGDNMVPHEIDRMHFLLEKPSLDEPKTVGPVTVGDMGQMRVVSIAHQGKLTPEDVERYEQKLKNSVQQKQTLKVSGEARLLGYNGPMTPETKRYWEIQLPVTVVKSEQ
jgi:hypothetical protein